MNTQYFQYVLVVDRERSISRAAERLFISQPSLSKAIREMEDTLGYAVFERSPKGVIPTPEGEKLLVSARRIVAELEKMESIRTPDQADTLSLRFSPAALQLSGSGLCQLYDKAGCKQGDRYTHAGNQLPASDQQCCQRTMPIGGDSLPAAL